jgi:hypothetical protein
MNNFLRCGPPANLLIAILMVCPIACHASTKMSTAIVIGDHSVGFASYQKDSKIFFKLRQYQKVKPIGRVTNKDGSVFILIEPQIIYNKSERKKILIPRLWIKEEDIVLSSAMKKWHGCWPFTRITFRDGVVDVEIVLDRYGAGNLSQSDGNVRKIAVRTYSENDIVDIRDEIGTERYTFLLKDAELFSLAMEKLAVVRRNCPIK